VKKIKKVGNKIDRGIAVLIYADPGIGKTTLAATLPVDETLIINTECGLGPLLGTGHNVWDLDGDEVKQLEDMYRYLRTQEHPFKYVVLDNISDLEQKLIHYFTKDHGKDVPELREYGDAAFTIKEYARLFRDLVFCDISVVVNAWEFPYTYATAEGVTITKAFPKVSEKFTRILCGIFDVVGHLEIHEKTQQRWIRIGANDQFITKTQFKGLDLGEQADMPLLLNKLYQYDYKEGSDEEPNTKQQVQNNREAV